jgi:signal transduction histidine kinase
VSSVAGRLPAALARLTRRPDEGVLGGVCTGLARTARVDATLVRLVFALLSFAGGAGIAAYAGAWIGLPAHGGPQPGRVRRAAGILLVAAGALVALRSVGVTDSVLWPAAIVGTGVVVAVHRGGDATRAERTVRAVAAAALVVGGSLLFLETATSAGDGGSLVAPSALVVVLFLVVGPWVWRLAQERDAERTERIRAQERADMAARVHDSVLQTLALVQRSADDPRRVAGLARRQERELRGWLYGGTGEGDGAETLARALEDALADVEELHGVRVELVQTGDAPLDDRLRALVLAAREAVGNAAVHSGVRDVAVFADVGDGEVSVYVRDRGVGFARESVPDDRRGIAESIEARLARHGGKATIRSTPGEGTEVELRLPLETS